MCVWGGRGPGEKVDGDRGHKRSRALAFTTTTMELTSVVNGVPDSRTSTSYNAWPVTAA